MKVAGLLACALILLAQVARVSAASDPRATVAEIEWRTPSGYERCAAVLAARRPAGFLAWTAGHCAEHPFSIVRFFNGSTLSGGAVHVLALSDSSDSARLLIAIGRAQSRGLAVAVPAPRPPPLGAPLAIVGHPVAALLAPNRGRWTITFARMGETVDNPATGALEYEVYCGRCGPGDSGGGVFDAEHRLIGIVYGVTEIENAADGRLPDGLYADVVPLSALR